MTVLLITCSYLNQEFVQIGYYVNNEYLEPFEPENYPNPVDINKLQRTILANEPRVTRRIICWDQALLQENPQLNVGITTHPQPAGSGSEDEDIIVDDDEELDEEEIDEEDEEDNDDDREIDLEAEDEMDEDEIDAVEGENDLDAGEDEDVEIIDENEVGNNDESDQYYQNDGMEIINEDSIDISRMLQK